MGVSKGFPWVSEGFRYRCNGLGPLKLMRFTIVEGMGVGFPAATEYPYYNINKHTVVAQGFWMGPPADMTFLEF